MYASGTILDNGCSVVCMASLATYMTGHQYYPDELASYFGGKCDNNVQRLEYMSDILELPYYKAENYRYVLDALRDGKVVIQLMNSKSLFTNSQHFILIKGYNENGLLDVLDPSEKNRSGWYLMDKFENGFTEDELCWGYDGAWIYDPDQMPDDPFIYEPPVRAYVEPRYNGLVMTEEETHLLAKLIYVEARGESEDGQQAIAEVVLNRYTSGLFGKSLSAMIQRTLSFHVSSSTPRNRPRRNMRPSTGPCMVPMCCQRMSCSMAESVQRTANGVPSEATSSVTQEDTWQQKPTD